MIKSYILLKLGTSTSMIKHDLISYSNCLFYLYFFTFNTLIPVYMKINNTMELNHSD